MALRYVFEQKIESGVSYRLKLGSEGLKLEVAEVSISTNQPETKIFVDGEDMGTKKQQKIIVGIHDLKLVKLGYETINEKIMIISGKNKFEYKMKEVEDVPLTITSTPVGADVYADGVKIGVTPLSLFYPSGSHRLKLTKDGYESLNENIIVVAPETNKAYTLKETVSYLTINTHPRAEVFIDGNKITELRNIKLAKPSVKVLIKMEKAVDLEQTVILKKDEKVTIDMFPKPAVGKIQIAVIPKEAQIELTDEDGKVYAATGAKAFNYMMVGSYKLVVKAEGYIKYRETIDLKENEKISRSVTLASFIRASNIILVQGGTFQMGGNDGENGAKLIHSVTVSDFMISKHEITQKEWIEIMGSNPSKFQGDDLPVENVSWDDCQEYIKEINTQTGLNYSLPTEAEWEYAARGGIKALPKHLYSGSDNVKDVAWYFDNSDNKTHSVGLKQANELGIYDMSGNVAEWCSDLYGDYTPNPQINPQGATSGKDRVIRGGSWNRYADGSRVAYRRSSSPDDRSKYIGFRLVLGYK